MRTIFLAASVAMLAFSIASAGCSSTSPSSSSSSPSVYGSTPPSNGGAASDGICANVVVAGYDTSCMSDYECVAVPAGGNTCDPCNAGSGDFVCKLSGVNSKDRERYANDLSSALSSLEGTSTYQQCVVASCPAGDLVPACVDGQCKVIPSSALIRDE
jgi:hypothetical protein